MRRITVFLLAFLLATQTPFAAEAPSYRGRTVEQWSSDLGHVSSAVRVAAAKALALFKSDAHQAVDALLVALNDRNADVRLYSAYGLGQIKQRPAASLEALTKLLSDEDEHVRYSAEWSLARVAQAVAVAEPTEVDIKKIDEHLAAAEAALSKHVERAEHLKQVQQARELIQKATEKSPPIPPTEETKVEEVPQERPQEHAAEAPAHQFSQDLRSDDKLTQLKAIESLRQLGRADQLIRAWETIEKGGFLYWHLSRALVRVGEAAVPELSKALRHEDEDICFQAAQCLRQMGPDAIGSLPLLLALIEDTAVSDDMRASAILVLESFGPIASDATGTLTRLLESGEQDTILAASARALAAIGPEARAATPALLKVLQTNDLWGDTRIAAARALARVAPDSTEAVQTLMPLLDQEDIFFVAGVADAIGDFGPTAAHAVARLMQLLERSSDDRRQAVIQAIGKIGAPAQAAASLLIARLTEPDEYELVQVAAALAIARIGEDAVRSLAEQLDHPDLRVRRTVVRAYVEIGSHAGPATEQLLSKFRQQYEDEDVRALSAIALGQIGPDANAAIATLTAAITDEELSVYLRSMSAVSIGQIDPASMPTLIAALDDPSPELQVAAAYSLQRMPAPHAAALPTLIRALDNAEVRQLAVRALADLGIASLPLLAESMADEMKDIDARLASLQVLGEFGEASATELLKALNDPELADSAFWTLRDLGNDAIPHLLAVAEDAANFTEDARMSIRELLEEFYDGIGGGEGEATWTGGHALMEQPQPEMSNGLGAALDSPPSREATALPLLTEPERALPPEPEPAVESRPPEETVEPPSPQPVPDAEFNPGETAQPRTLEPATGVANSIESELEESAEPPLRDAQARTEFMPLESPPEHVEPAATEPAAENTVPPPAGHKSVKVFYGTNRKPVDGDAVARPKLVWYLWPVIAIALVGFVIYFVRRYRRGGLVKTLTRTAGILLIGLIAFRLINSEDGLQPSLGQQETDYGTEYSDHVELGYCEVTIPDVHRDGQLEGPRILRLQFTEDPLKHIVLKRIERLESDAFFEDLDSELETRGRSVLVFVHGYNVTFEDAARRTAQMSHDLNFAGAPVFYSWPSQGNWRKYRVDEKNVELSVDQLKTFLVDIAHRSKADTINLIAHSMGNRALTHALREIEVSATEEEKLFNQVVLAAPDIDADIFKQRIAPAIVGQARHITLYASSNDLALAASQEFNSGDPRAGDAGQDLVVVPGIETIDVSAGDTSLLGHSYFGNSASVLRDIEVLLHNQPAASRQFLKPVRHQGATYWQFLPATAARGSLPGWR